MHGLARAQHSDEAMLACRDAHHQLFSLAALFSLTSCLA